jgi:RNA polymerase sigma-B factor
MTTSPLDDRSAPAPDERSLRTAELLARAHAPGVDPAEAEACLDQVVELNMRVARAVARRYARKGIPTEDLTQVAYLALVRAVRGYDPRTGADLLSYAVPTITGEIRRHFRDHGWTIRPPRDVQRAHTRLLRSGATLDRIDESALAGLADQVEESVEVVREALQARSCFSLVSLDTPTTGPGGDEPGETTARTVPDPRHDQHADALEARLLLAPLLTTLTERERAVIDLRFTHELSQREIAERLDLSQVQVSRLLARILTGMRQALGPLDRAG